MYAEDERLTNVYTVLQLKLCLLSGYVLSSTPRNTVIVIVTRRLNSLSEQGSFHCTLTNEVCIAVPEDCH